jgi:hypothetical protein
MNWGICGKKASSTQKIVHGRPGDPADTAQPFHLAGKVQLQTNP